MKFDPVPLHEVSGYFETRSSQMLRFGIFTMVAFALAAVTERRVNKTNVRFFRVGGVLFEICTEVCWEGKGVEWRIYRLD
jgi:hypothetical protein